jgi:hypothetical protein
MPSKNTFSAAKQAQALTPPLEKKNSAIPVHVLDGTVPRHKYKTNYRLKAGDQVVLKEHATVSGYWHDDVFAPRGSWASHVMLAGALGKVVTARTPWVCGPGNETRYFANVDIEHSGGVSRVRMSHTALRRLTQRQRAAL